MEDRITTAGVSIKDGKVLVAKRKEGGPLSLKWEFPGGKNRYNETVEDTLIREWKEELGVDISVGVIFLEFDFENNNTIYHLKCCYIDIVSKHFSINEHVDLRYVAKNELIALDLADSDKKIAAFLISKDIIK